MERPNGAFMVVRTVVDLFMPGAIFMDFFRIVGGMMR